ncbi:MAG: glycosyltransferase family 4 protein [Planctomycetes bacterium]|nr:glycosyltransferase family 4 protein [Planctomycetota bacterium]
MNNTTLHIDLGGISYHPNEKITGIPRVTLSIARELSQLREYNDVNLNVMSLMHDGHEVPNEVLEKFGLVEGQSKLVSGSGTILLLDVYYFKYNFLNKLDQEVRDKYQVVDYIHDILPLTMESFFDVSAFKFKHLVRQSFRFADAIMTPSRKTADDIIEYILADPDIKVGDSLKLGYSYHGADFATNPTVTDGIGMEASIDKPYFLMVGTLEIRKNHLFVLNTFEKLWEEGVDVTLCIAGRIGWKVEPLIERLQNHPERNKRLFLFNGPSDAELSKLYRDAYCLIFASIDEGFGLPIVEAAHYALPLLLSDISIFHEIAGDNARYFSLENEQYLATAINQFIADDTCGQRKEDSAKIPQISWLDSAKNMLDVIQEDRWYCEISSDKSVIYPTL